MADLDPMWVRNQVHKLARENFEVFAIRAFSEVNDEPYEHNWHVSAIAYQIMRLHAGEIKRLLITMPPRSLKSWLSSVCLPAWLLGRNPSEKIICASYAQPLSNDFAFQMRRLVQSPWYQQVFPHTHIDPKKSGVEEIATTRGGYRLSTSAGGGLTGRGANYIIIDDPIKAADASSEVVRESVLNWYGGTVSSRFNNPKSGRMVVVAQRLHMDDLPGHLIAMTAWDHLDLPLIAWEDQQIYLSPEVCVDRTVGNLLHGKRLGETEIARLRSELGTQAFEAQYNQRPLPPGGALFKQEWLNRFVEPPNPQQIEAIIQSWDTAYDIQEHHDYSVCSTWAVSGKRYFLLDIFRERLEFHALEKAVFMLRDKWGAELVIVEKAGSGTSIYQNIRQATRQAWIVTMQPEGSKQHRASQQTPKFERGEVWVPEKAPWLKAFLDEFSAFPHGKHDDQVDSVVQFLRALDMQDLGTKLQSARAI